MEIQEIRKRIECAKIQYSDVDFKLQQLDGGGLMVIIRGGLNSNNPTQYMNGVVSFLVETELYNEFIEKFLDNPWVRVVFFEFNNIQFNN